MKNLMLILILSLFISVSLGQTEGCLVDKNLKLNGCDNVHVCDGSVIQGDLRRPPVRGWFDACLIGDATYDAALQVSVAATLAGHLKPGGWAWCAESVRTTDTGFRRACEDRGLHVAEREVREVEDGHASAVRITEVRQDEIRDLRH